MHPSKSPFLAMRLTGGLCLILPWNLNLMSCKEESSFKAVHLLFEVKNTTINPIRIQLFYRDNSVFADTLVGAQDSLVLDRGSIYPAPAGPTYSLTNTLDSAVIIFYDKKQLTHTTRHNTYQENSILLGMHYVSFPMVGSDSIRRQLTLSESDYLRAR